MSDRPDGPDPSQTSEEDETRDPEDQARSEAEASSEELDARTAVEEGGEARDGQDGGRRAPMISEVSELSGGQQSEGADSETSEGAPGEPSAAELKIAIESLIFVSDRVVTAQQLGRILKRKVAEVRELLGELADEYRDRGVQLVEVSGGYQFRSAPAAAKYVQALVAQKPVRLTRAQLETLALVAYRQPITRPEIDEVRGVDTGSAVKVLLDRGLIKMLGRKDEAGRPMLYGTTPYFLEFFGLRALRDLPTLKEFTDLSEENRTLFKRKTGEDAAQVEEELAAQEAQEAQAEDPEDARESSQHDEPEAASAGEQADPAGPDGASERQADGEALSERADDIVEDHDSDPPDRADVAPTAGTDVDDVDDPAEDDSDEPPSDERSS